MRRWSAIALFWAALILGVYSLLSAEKARRSSLPDVPGWDDLHECGSLTSFDGMKTLEFERSHKVHLTEKSANDPDSPERQVDGAWSFDVDKARYVVILEDNSSDYALVKPEDSSACVLAPGNVGAVNLRDSWFGPKDE